MAFHAFHVPTSRPDRTPRPWLLTTQETVLLPTLSTTPYRTPTAQVRNISFTYISFTYISAKRQRFTTRYRKRWTSQLRLSKCFSNITFNYILPNFQRLATRCRTAQLEFPGRLYNLHTPRLHHRLSPSTNSCTQRRTRRQQRMASPSCIPMQTDTAK